MAWRWQSNSKAGRFYTWCKEKRRKAFSKQTIVVYAVYAPMGAKVGEFPSPGEAEYQCSSLNNAEGRF